MSTATKIVFIVGILLLIYGYVSRFLHIYFFWDSKYFGWVGITTGLLLLLIDIRMERVRLKQNIFFVRLMVAAIVIFLAIEASAVIWLKSSTAYKDFIETIRTDEVVKADMGEIRGFGLIPGINIVDIIKAISSESLVFVVTIRGQKAYKELEVTIKKTTPINWTVVSSEEINRK